MTREKVEGHRIYAGMISISSEAEVRSENASEDSAMQDQPQ